MKKLLTLLPAALIPLFVYSCGFHKTADVAKEVVQEQIDEHAADLRERFDALPRTIPLSKPDVAPVLPSYKPKVKAKPHVQPTARPVGRPVPRPRPIAPQAPVEESEVPLPPQRGVICIFPLNMVPNCTPEPAGRMP